MNVFQGKWQLLKSLKPVVIDPAGVPTFLLFISIIYVSTPHLFL